MTTEIDEYPVCVVIEDYGRATTPPGEVAIPSNENSIRAMSKKIRVYVLRDFLLRKYSSSLVMGSTILDVAGGKGDLSWILRNFDGINSIIVDPRIPNHQRLMKSVDFLLNHPEEAMIRSVEGLPTHQPLAKLVLPRIMNQRGLSGAKHSLGQTWGSSPSYMRIHVDDFLVGMLRSILNKPYALNSWDEYWENEKRENESNKVHYGGTVPKSNGSECGTQITDSRKALDILQSLHMIVGFHPDQATEAAIDLALLLKVPFAVVPCCVFPSEFPERKMNGKRVRHYSDFVEYLCSKHHKIRMEKLPFVETDTAKNTVLYMLKDDFS